MHEGKDALDLEKVDQWIGDGAKPSDTVRSLIRKARKAASSAA
jgi:small subunit ribosomal protein S16